MRATKTLVGTRKRFRILNANMVPLRQSLYHFFYLFLSLLIFLQVIRQLYITGIKRERENTLGVLHDVHCITIWTQKDILFRCACLLVCLECLCVLDV